MRIGIVFDLKEDYGIYNEDVDYYDFCFLSEAEAAFTHLQLAGYDVVYIGSPATLLEKIKTNSLDCDIVYNIAEGYKSRNREGIIPSVPMLSGFLCPCINIKQAAFLSRIAS